MTAGRLTAAVGFVAIASAIACTRPNPEYCDEVTACASGACDLETHTCGTDDAPTADGPRPDGAPAAVVHTNQTADLVLGQPDFASGSDNGCNSSSLLPLGVTEANGRLYAHDGDERVLIWSPVPIGNNAPSAMVLGRTTFTDCASVTAVSASTVGGTGEVSAANGKLAIADPLHNRILLWRSIPISNGEAATAILGQSNGTNHSAGTSASQLSNPAGVWTDGIRVIVADQYNHRVLIWNSFPMTNAAPADVVVGQRDFATATEPTTPSASNLFAPASVWSDGIRLYVADSGHHRILIWNSLPTSNGEAADVVVGQSSFTTAASGLSATALFDPHGIVTAGDALFIADLQNDRVMVYTTIPTSNGASATFVLGQPSLDVGADNPPPTASSLSNPRDLAVTTDHIWVTDEKHRRILRFSLFPDG